MPVTILEQAKVEKQRATKEGEEMKAAIYCRVSTDNQEREGTSLQTQLDLIVLPTARTMAMTYPIASARHLADYLLNGQR